MRNSPEQIAECEALQGTRVMFQEESWIRTKHKDLLKSLQSGSVWQNAGRDMGLLQP